ncbi:TonB-dependent receptor plug domain-containing protein, partial [uncultured Sphingomonas sp.]|uniref:TonB-dependent receptor plug domain-containing protein n=1 Tax=uncultured Sphingomonas sp. TaxID=158754 RepID=UPI0035CB6F8F
MADEALQSRSSRNVSIKAIEPLLSSSAIIDRGRPSTRRMLYCASTILLATGAPAFAQSRPATSANADAIATGSSPEPDARPQEVTGNPNSADQEVQGLREVVVTAQKRAENLQRVPIAVTVASGPELAARGITNSLQLVSVAPGLNIRLTAGSFQPSIRGIGTSSNVVENPVALYIDGVYFPQQREGLRQLDDIEQIAILKGPQGTLFGRNATGGVIQITTLAPSQEFRGQARA